MLGVPSTSALTLSPLHSRVTLEEATAQHSTRFPAVVDLKWRIDVTISSSAARRAMTPTILMQLTLSDGSVHSFEMPQEQFHSMRYNVARTLLEMGDVRSHPVMQLAFEADQATLD